MVMICVVIFYDSHKKMLIEFMITIGDADHPFSSEEKNIVERIAYYKYKAQLMASYVAGLKYKVGEAWIPFDYMHKLDEINEIYRRLNDILTDSLEELEDIEKANEADPLAFNKECHNCGRPTKFYNDACNRHCDDLVYENSFVCRRGADCVQCKYIIK